jgi:hypothetical protein
VTGREDICPRTIQFRLSTLVLTFDFYGRKPASLWLNSKL